MATVTRATTPKTPSITVDYQPRGACQVIQESQADEVLISGPAGTGKSRACLVKLFMVALLNPGMRGLMVRKTATSLTTTALVTWKRDVIAEAEQLGIVEYYGGSSQEPAQYRFANGSKIILGGMDKATRIMSSEYDLIYVQEATELTENDWEALTTRLRSWVVPFQQIIADCNPDAPTHWLKQRIDSGRTLGLESRHEDNPQLFDINPVDNKPYVTLEGAKYINKLDNLTGVRYLRLRKGIWAAAEGMIYDDWDSSINLIDQAPISPTWRRFWSVDFGYRNPTVIQHWAESPDGALILYREFYGTGKTQDQWAKHILTYVTKSNGTWTEPKPSAIICDHDAEGRVLLERELNLPTRPANKKVLEGIQVVQRRIREQRIFIQRNCLVSPDQSLIDAKRPICTAEELPGYVWEDKQTKEQPRKEDDHGMDAMRYMVAYKDLKNRVRVDRFGYVGR